MNDQEILKAYAEFSGADWWPKYLSIYDDGTCGMYNDAMVNKISQNIAALAIRGAALTDLLTRGVFYVSQLQEIAGMQDDELDQAIIAALKELEG